MKAALPQPFQPPHRKLCSPLTKVETLPRKTTKLRIIVRTNKSDNAIVLTALTFLAPTKSHDNQNSDNYAPYRHTYRIDILRRSCTARNHYGSPAYKLNNIQNREYQGTLSAKRHLSRFHRTFTVFTADDSQGKTSTQPIM